MNSERINTSVGATTTSLAGDHLDLIWGCEAIGEAIGRSPKSVYYMLVKGELPGRQVGRRWVASRRKLQEHFEEIA